MPSSPLEMPMIDDRLMRACAAARQRSMQPHNSYDTHLHTNPPYGEARADITPEPEVSSTALQPRRFRSVDVLDLFEDLRRQPLPQLPQGATVYRRPQMAEEAVPANAEAV
eukprot:COSAG01_NODE_7314_length_3255_cov_4.176489_4_plen_111_part_00